MRVLHQRRKRLAEAAAREAAGESLWTDHFDERVRMKMLHAAVDASSEDGFAFFAHARGMIMREEGLPNLSGTNYDDRVDLLDYLLRAADEMMPTVIEALSLAFVNQRLVSETGRWVASGLFDTAVSTILREHRISFDLIDHRMVEFTSREMHEAIVAPALTLLGGLKGWAAVESAYQDALAEISKGSPGDAVTDVGTALQEALTMLGCDGNALGPLIKSARTKGLLAPHDSPLLEAIEKILNWVSADRSQTGDAHSASSASVSDAWFAVHVVGAIILRLADGAKRG